MITTMKKTFLCLFILITLKSFSQDTTIATLSIKARLVQTLVPYVKQNIEDTAYINLFARWVKKYDTQTPPSNTDIVTVDSISVSVISQLYGICQSFPQGAANVGNDFGGDILAIRNANPYLNRLCTAIDVTLAAIVVDARKRGKKILTGKNN